MDIRARETGGPDGEAGRGRLSRRRFLGGSASALAAGAVVPGFFRTAATRPAAGVTDAALASTVPDYTVPGYAAADYAVPDYTAGLRALGRTALRVPGSRPYPDLAAGTDTSPASSTLSC